MIQPTLVFSYKGNWALGQKLFYNHYLQHFALGWLVLKTNRSNLYATVATDDANTPAYFA